ncbi:MAG: hypothetical protein RLZZ58_479 [Pseudomonadota bacterium]
MTPRPGLYQRMRTNAQVRYGLFLLGCLLMIIAPLLGPLPGPGFFVLFPVGLALTLQNSAWAKRRYVDFKRRHPRYGGWADKGLRRASPGRRAARAEKEGEAGANPPAAD